MAPMRATSTDCYGECDNAQSEIRIRADLDPVKAANTTLHEVLHACYFVGALRDEDNQERIVSVLANQFTQVARDNPRLMEWLAWQLGDAA